MKWPLILRKTHDAEVFALRDQIKHEYSRALKDGRAQVHAWSRDAATNMFYTDRGMGDDPRARAVFTGAIQGAEKLFAPEKLEY